MVEVPTGGTGAGGAAEPRIKLYADANGHVGQIEVFNRQGGRLGALTQSASAFTLTREPGGGVRAVPFQIPPGEAARDRGILQRLRATHTIGRRMTNERLRTRGPNRQGPNQRTPGHQQQPLNRNQHQGGAPHDMELRRIRVERRIRSERSIRVGRHLRTVRCIPVGRRIKAARQTRVERRAKVVSRAKICREPAVRPVAAAVAARATSGINAQSGRVDPVFRKDRAPPNVAA